MNKLKLSVGILLVFILGALAGSLGTGMYMKHRIGEFVRGGPPTLMHSLMRRMSHQLKLTEEQETEIERIIEQANKDIAALRERYHPEFEKIMDKNFALIKETLGEEQKIKFEELQEELKNRRGRIGPKGMRRHAPHHKAREHPFAVMKERLNLTEEQAAKVGPIIDESIKKRRSVMQQQREQGFGRVDSMRDELRAIQESTENQLEAVLTKRQMEEYRRIQKKHRHEIFSDMPGPHQFDEMRP